LPDGLGRRVQKVVAGSPEVTYDYYYDADWRLLEVRKDSDTDPLEQYVWGLRYVDAPVVRFRDENTDGRLDDPGDSTLYYCQDANMNTTALVDTNGDVVERYVYDPYGKPTIHDSDWSDELSWANSKKNEILFAGYRYDPETGLYHVRYRMYHPTLGRWLQRDPVGYADGMGLYEYVGGTPATALDANGLERCTSSVVRQKFLSKIKAQVDVSTVVVSVDGQPECEGHQDLGRACAATITYNLLPKPANYSHKWLRATGILPGYTYHTVYTRCKVRFYLECRCHSLKIPLAGWTLRWGYHWDHISDDWDLDMRVLEAEEQDYTFRMKTDETWAAYDRLTKGVGKSFDPSEKDLPGMVVDPAGFAARMIARGIYRKDREEAEIYRFIRDRRMTIRWSKWRDLGYRDKWRCIYGW